VSAARRPLLGDPVAAGATIGVVTPATPPPRRSDVLRGIEWWRSHGYHVRLARGALERSGDFAGSPELRARDLQETFADPDVAAIQCMRGGYGSAEVVPLLDYDEIARTPKPFVGLSDITALHAALLRFSGLATFYGPSLTSLAVRPLPELTGRRLLEVLSGRTTGPVPYDPDGPYLRAIAPGRASGRLVGGCLPDLIHTLGTPWEIETDGALLFLEVQAYGPSWIDRNLLHLKQAGKLDRVAGVVVGELPYAEWGEGIGPDWPRTSTLEDVLEARLGALGAPVLYGLPCDHGSAMVTLPLGVQATLDADARTLTIDEPALT
jgi:muramoyltetrapeptide carboxypeptidase